MSLITQTTKFPMFKNEQGFKYPEAFRHWEEHDKMIWHYDEVPLGQDVIDFQKATPEERKFIVNILRLFTQNDIMVGAGYDVMIRIFKPTEVQMMLRGFADREATHIAAYSHFTETLGLSNRIYSEFLEIPCMETKTDYLERAKIKKYEDYKRMGLSDAQVDAEFRRAIARMTAVYAGGAEGVSLMAQFAMLLKFQFEGRFKGLGQLVDWSIKDESKHVQGNSWLFRTFIEENHEIWDDELKFEIYEAMREMVAYEHALIDYLNPPHMPNPDIKRYVEFMADNALKQLGMKPNWNTIENPLPFMEAVTGISMQDFFQGTVTEYAVNAVTGNWQDLRKKNRDSAII